MVCLKTWLCTLGGLVGFVFIWHFFRRVKEPKINLSGGKVLITGGSKGIGYWTAYHCVKKGASVAIVARNEKLVRAARDELLKVRIYDSQQVIAISCDVSNFALLKEMIMSRFLDYKWESLDAIVCNAGVECVGTFNNLDVIEHHQVMDVNYFGAVHTIKACLPYLSNNNKKGSRIVVNSSMLGLTGMMCYSAYSASKFALRGLVESISQELRSAHIYCSLVFPPDVDTDQYKREKEISIPKEIRDISANAGLFRPEDIGKDITWVIENGPFSKSWGLDGWLLRNLTVGMTPTFSLVDTMVQAIFGGLLRVIAMWYSKEHATIGKKYLKEEIKKNKE